MTTVTLPPQPPADAGPMPPVGPPPPQLRQVRITADLMPDEVLSARRGRQLRGYVALGLAVAVLIVAGWAVAAKLSTSSAQNGLDSANAQAKALRVEQSSFGPLLSAQNLSAGIEGKLKTLMTGDLPWSKYVTEVSAAAPAGLQVTEVIGNTTGQTTSVQSNTIGQLAPGAGAVASLQISGTAANKDQVAAYLDSVGRIPGLAVPFLNGINSAPGGKLSFSATVLITPAALGGRFTTGSK